MSGPLERAAPLPPAAARRRTRSWMLLMLLSPVCLAIVLYISFGTAGMQEPAIQPRQLPAGYAPVTDSDFGYAVPAGYHQDPAWTDQNGDFFYGTATGYVAETMLLAHHAPSAATPPPVSFRYFGRDRAARLTLSDPRRVDVPGTAVAWEYQVRGPGGYRAEALDTWEPGVTTQMWLLVHAPPGVAHVVFSSLRGNGRSPAA